MDFPGKNIGVGCHFHIERSEQWSQSYHHHLSRELEKNDFPEEHGSIVLLISPSNKNKNKRRGMK